MMEVVNIVLFIRFFVLFQRSTPIVTLLRLLLRCPSKLVNPDSSEANIASTLLVFLFNQFFTKISDKYKIMFGPKNLKGDIKDNFELERT